MQSMHSISPFFMFTIISLMRILSFVICSAKGLGRTGIHPVDATAAKRCEHEKAHAHLTSSPRSIGVSY